MKLLRAFLAATFACVVASACGRTPFELSQSEGDEGAPRDPGVAVQPPSRDAGSGIPRRPDTPPTATAPPPRPTRPVMDASQPLEDSSRPGTDGDTGAVTDAARPRDAETPSTDGSRDSAADVLVLPDCTCPPLDFSLDAIMGTTPIHLSAPYVFNIYCKETAVQLAHPPCSEVYRLSGCTGPNFAPPCLYMGVDQVSGFLLGSFVDASGEPWDLLSGSIAADPPVGRLGTGTFAATLRPRKGGDGDVVSMSGSFRACVPVFPACVGAVAARRE